MFAYNSNEVGESECLLMTVGLSDLLVLLNLRGLVVQTAELPLGESDAGLLVDGLHQRRQHLVNVWDKVSTAFRQNVV